MAVPDTNTFTLQNVQSTVDPSKNNLNDLFTVASGVSPSVFDSSYNPNATGTSNNLLNFRNYGAFTSFSTSTNATSSRLVCAKLLDITRYHTGTATYPVAGDTVWNTSSGTGVPGNGWYKSANNTAYFTTSGVVTSVAIC